MAITKQLQHIKTLGEEELEEYLAKVHRSTLKGQDRSDLISACEDLLETYRSRDISSLMAEHGDISDMVGIN